jgi:ASC-1-like (ASCH) protein
MSQLYAISSISNHAQIISEQLTNVFNHIFPHIFHINQKSRTASFTDLIKENLKFSSVVVSGFSLTSDTLPIVPIVHIHIITTDNASQLDEECRLHHNVSSSIYHDIIRSSDITHFIRIFTPDNAAKSLSHLIDEVTYIFNMSQLHRSAHHVMDVAEPYHGLIKSGRKPVEGRKISGRWSKLRRGDIITMTSPGKDSFRVEIVHINFYLPSTGDPLTFYLENETLIRALPNVDDIDEGRQVYLQWSTEEEIKSMGMMGIVVRVI